LSRAPHLTLPRLVVVVGGAMAFCALAAALALSVGITGAEGARHLAFLDLRHALAGGTGNADAEVLRLSRLPRVIAGAIAGAGLAGAGATYQALLRNPLAEPYTLGVSSGASVGAVIAIRFALPGVSFFAFAGATASVLVIWRLARVGQSLPAATLLLAGVTLALLCSAATSVVQITSSFAEAYRILRWMMGGLDWIPYPDLGRGALLVALGLCVLIAISRDLNAMAAGPDAASSVGVNADRTMLIAFAAASLVVGAVISVAGPIGFVGLIVPHAIRAIGGPDHRVLLPASIFAGAGFVLLCDTVARTALSPTQLPVGVVTALIGGPFFLSLLVREKTRSRLWG
jgi:iron complex transport system permease protein